MAEPSTDPETTPDGDAILTGEAGGELDRVQDTLLRLTQLVEGARSMPLSASCVLNRSEVLGLLDELRVGLPSAIGEARELLGDRVGVVAAGRRQAGELLEQARAERERLVSEATVLDEAEQRAEQLLEVSHEQAEAMRREVEDYVDGKLATFEVVLTKTLEAVHRGRSQLDGSSSMTSLAPEVPARSLGETDYPEDAPRTGSEREDEDDREDPADSSR